VGNPILGAIAFANDAPNAGRLHGEMYLVKVLPTADIADIQAATQLVGVQIGAAQYIVVLIVNNVSA
jgi:hypothetical protein